MNETLQKPQKKRLIVAMTGATGAIYGVRILQILKDLDDWESHLVISSAGLVNLKYELDMSRQVLYQLADVTHGIDDIAASIASGYRADCMFVFVTVLSD